MEDPALFEKFNYLSRRDTSDLVEEFGNEMRQFSGRCIDIGSGPGDVLVDLILPRLNPDATILCSDISEKMVNFAREKYKDNRRLSFDKLDIEALDLPENRIGKFDHALSFYCLHWCQDMRLVFENIFNLLRPGGTAISTSVVNFPSMDAYIELAAMPRYQPYLQDADRYVPVYQHSERPRKTLKALIEDVGFEVRHCSVRERSYTFESREVLGEFMVAINPFVSRIPADLMEPYKEDLVRAIEKQNIVFNRNNNNQGESSILCVYSAFAIHLKKPLTK